MITEFVPSPPPPAIARGRPGSSRVPPGRLQVERVIGADRGRRARSVQTVTGTSLIVSGTSDTRSSPGAAMQARTKQTARLPRRARRRAGFRRPVGRASSPVGGLRRGDRRPAGRGSEVRRPCRVIGFDRATPGRRSRPGAARACSNAGARREASDRPSWPRRSRRGGPGRRSGSSSAWSRAVADCRSAAPSARMARPDARPEPQRTIDVVLGGHALVAGPIRLVDDRQLDPLDDPVAVRRVERLAGGANCGTARPPAVVRVEPGAGLAPEPAGLDLPLLQSRRPESIGQRVASRLEPSWMPRAAARLTSTPVRSISSNGPIG